MAMHDETAKNLTEFSCHPSIYVTSCSSLENMAQQFAQFGPQAAKAAVVGGSALFGTYWMATNCLYNGMILVMTLQTAISFP